MVSQGSKVKLNGIIQVSSITAVNFTSGESVYTVMAENGKDSSTYTIKHNKLTSQKSFENTNISIAPNPAYDKIEVETTFIPEKIEVYSLTGQLILSTASSTTKSVLDLKTIQAGHYILVLYHPERYSTSKHISVFK